MSLQSLKDLINEVESGKFAEDALYENIKSRIGDLVCSSHNKTPELILKRGESPSVNIKCCCDEFEKLCLSKVK